MWHSFATQDLARAFIQVLGNEKASRQVFNISGDKYVTFDGLARACAKVILAKICKMDTHLRNFMTCWYVEKKFPFTFPLLVIYYSLVLTWDRLVDFLSLRSFTSTLRNLILVKRRHFHSVIRYMLTYITHSWKCE